MHSIMSLSNRPSPESYLRSDLIRLVITLLIVLLVMGALFTIERKNNYIIRLLDFMRQDQSALEQESGPVQLEESPDTEAALAE